MKAKRKKKKCCNENGYGRFTVRFSRPEITANHYGSPTMTWDNVRLIEHQAAVTFHLHTYLRELLHSLRTHQIPSSYSYDNIWYELTNYLRRTITHTYVHSWYHKPKRKKTFLFPLFDTNFTLVSTLKDCKVKKRLLEFDVVSISQKTCSLRKLTRYSSNLKKISHQSKRIIKKMI